MAEKKQLTEEEMLDLLIALKDIQKKQGELNAKNGRQLSDDEVRERVSRKDYGFSAENPILLKNVPISYAFFDNIKSPAGTPFVKERRSSTQGAEGHVLDVYEGYYLDVDGMKVETTIYVDCYCSCNVPCPPYGWQGKDQKIENKTGCLIPLIAFLAMGLLIGSAVAQCF